MGGRMWLESVQGLGSTFHFTVRFGCPPAALPATELRQQLAAYAGRSILIADDNPAARRALGNLCRQLGFTVDAHASGDGTGRPAPPRQRSARRPARLADAGPERTGHHQGNSPGGAARAAETDSALLVDRDQYGTGRSPGGRCRSAQADQPAACTPALSKALGLDHPVAIAARVERPDLSSIQQLKEADILVVDDIELNRDLMRELFATAGIQVRLASNGDEAIAMVRARKPDVILMDCQMPVMDGLPPPAHCARCRNTPACPSSP